MAEQGRLLIVDDDPIVAESLGEFLSGEGYFTATATSSGEAMELLRSAEAGADGDHPEFGIVILELQMARDDGMTLLRQLHDHFPSVAPIVVTGYGKIETAVEAVKLGAVDYLTKPVVEDELRLAVSKAANRHALVAENETLRSQLSERMGKGQLIGADYRMQKVYDMVDAVAPTKTTVLLTGESGTGKTMVAQAVHAISPRSGGPFVTFSCGAIPETLLESELFGHVKGAFTGADFDKPGKCLAADGGTLFIDEINSATPTLQLKLLRVLQEKAFEPVGSTKTQKVDVRFVLASNEALPALVEQGRFREDLYYRINVVNIALPALCERTGDVPLLAEHFLQKYCGELKRERRFSDEALAAMRAYRWPGNVRELENAVERAVVLSRGPVIEVGDLPEAMLNGRAHGGRETAVLHGDGVVGQGGGWVRVPALAGGWQPTPLVQAMHEPERQILLAALEANAWNRQTTARQLDINRTTLYKKIKLYHLDEPV